MATSGTYNFQNIEVEELIREAFERLGVLGEMVEAQKLDSARRSINLLLLEWMNKSTNLWTLKSAYLPLIQGQAKYILSDTTGDITQANLRTTTRQLQGVSQTNTANTYDNGGGGVSDQAFDGNSATACTQNVNNGNISYDYGDGVTQQINFIGITSNTTQDYTLLLESSSDTINWVTVLEIPSQTFVAGLNVWFDVITPSSARAYRIRETGGNALDLQEMYFNNNILDFTITDVGRNEYYSYSNKALQARPSIYYLDKQSTRVLYLWPTPSAQYNCLQYTYEESMQDVGLYTNTLDIPPDFYPALVAGLTYYLAIKYKPDSAQERLAEYEQAFNLATVQDTESVPLTIGIDYYGGCR